MRIRALTIGTLAITLASPMALAQVAGEPDTPAALATQQKAEIKHGDPKRWYQDDKTFQARLQNLRKEINAAYAEAKISCKHEPTAERNSCMKEARRNYDHDMADARNEAMASR